MVSADENLNQLKMSNEGPWTLKEIREAYGEALRAWNELFPMYPRERKDCEEILPEGLSIDREDKEHIDTFRKKATETIPKLKESADQSGNAVTWRRGDPLDGLDQSLRNRILKALEFGI